MTVEPAPAGVPGRWWHVAVGFVVGVVLAAVVGSALLSGYDVENTDDLPLWTLAPLQLALWSGLVAAPIYAAARAGRSPVEAYRVRWTGREAWTGFGIGIATQLVAVPLLYLPLILIFDELDVSESAEELTDRADALWERGLLVLLVAIGAPLIEEVFYRGLLQGLLLRHLAPPLGIGLGAVLFAASHFQVVTFPALVLFGVVAGVLAHRDGHLGRAVWAHIGFNATTVVVLLL